jgi:hypothetical protein
MSDWMKELQQQYEAKIGEPSIGWGYPKSHWTGCDRGSSNPDRRVELPNDAPADFISCNACLIRGGYICILPCNPREVGWPHSWCRCDKCEYGLDCETWARVRGIGEQVQLALNACHPVTWADTGLVPFHNGDLFFPDKVALDNFMASLTERYPAHFDQSCHNPCDCFPAGWVPATLSDATQDSEMVDGDGVCRHPHCKGYLSDFGFYPDTHYTNHL